MRIAGLGHDSENLSTASPQAPRWLSWLMVVLFLVVGIWIRAIYIEKKDYLHLDEGYSVGNSLALSETLHRGIQDHRYPYGQWVSSREFLKQFDPRNSLVHFAAINIDISRYSREHVPLYFYILNTSFNIGGLEITTALMANCLIALVSFFLTFLLCKQLGLGRLYSVFIAGIWFVSLAALSNTLYIRMYECLTAVCLLTSWWFLYQTQHPPSNRRARIFYVVATVLVVWIGLYTHYFYAFTLFAALLAYFLSHWIGLRRTGRAEKRRLLGATLGGVGLLLALYPQSVVHIVFSGRTRQILESAALQKEAPTYWQKFIDTLNVLHSDYAFGFPLLLLVLVIAILVVWKKCEPSSRTMIVWSSLLFLFPFVLIAWLAPYNSLRYLAHLAPFGFVMAGVLALQLDRRFMTHLVFATLFGLVLSTYILNKPEYVQEFASDLDFRLASHHTVVSEITDWGVQSTLPFLINDSQQVFMATQEKLKENLQSVLSYVTRKEKFLFLSELEYSADSHVTQEFIHAFSKTHELTHRDTLERTLVFEFQRRPDF